MMSSSSSLFSSDDIHLSCIVSSSIPPSTIFEAAYYLGFEFFHGDPLPKNREMAKYWLTKIVEAGYQDQIQETDFEEAKDMLKTIETEEQDEEE